MKHSSNISVIGFMKIKVSLDEKLVKQIQKIAAEQNTTLNDLVRAHLRELVSQRLDSRQREMEKIAKKLSTESDSR
jgi:metal-responsive CopG/Arc/MetJ family transcriptional regulator